MPGGEKYSRCWQRALAALLSSDDFADAARTARVSERTLRAWFRRPAFLAAYRARCKELAEVAMGQLHARNAKAVATLERNLTCGHPATEVRAAIAVLELSQRALQWADARSGDRESGEQVMAMNASDIVGLLTGQLAHLQTLDLSAAERARLTVTLAGALMKALNVHLVDQRYEALAAVLLERKGGESR